MKLIAVNEVHYKSKDGKDMIAKPGEVFDIDKKTADLLLAFQPIPPIRRLTDDEVELDKLRASAKANKPAEDDDDEDGDQSDDKGLKKVETSAGTKTTTAKSVPPASGAAEKSGY